MRRALRARLPQVGRALRARLAELRPALRARLARLRPALRAPQPFTLPFTLTFLLAALTAPASPASEYLLDRVGEALTTSALDGAFRARVSGTVDLEGYHVATPAPALLQTTRTELFNPRLTLFLDAQLGPHAYLFAQARADHGFDPGDGPSRRRADEYALRLTPWRDGRLNLQVGKFATIVGHWVNRHGTWESPFISAPLAYEHLTGIWDTEAVRSVNQLLQWSGVRPGLTPAQRAGEKRARVPVLWGPAYTTGLALSGRAGKFRASAELKNAPLSSRPTSWAKAKKWWTYPSYAVRLGYSPDPRWHLGLSAADGPYLRPSARTTTAPGFGLGDYRQLVFAADAAFAWHHWQVWAELFQTRFQIPRIGNADTLAGYLETKYKFTPQLFASLRWNRQLHGTLPDGPRGSVHWGRDVWRVDFAPGYRFTPHLQLKLQYSLQSESAAAPERTRLLATQLTARF